MCMELSKAKLDAVGDRLRTAVAPTDEDRAAYEGYRAGHIAALTAVEAKMTALGLQPVSRLKTVEAVVAKLRRQRIRLS